MGSFSCPFLVFFRGTCLSSSASVSGTRIVSCHAEAAPNCRERSTIATPAKLRWSVFVFYKLVGSIQLSISRASF